MRRLIAQQYHKTLNYTDLQSTVSPAQHTPAGQPRVTIFSEKLVIPRMLKITLPAQTTVWASNISILQLFAQGSLVFYVYHKDNQKRVH